LPHPQAATTTTSSSSKIPSDQLDSLVAPIALYPDPLLAQALAASRYPLEIIQLQQFMARPPELKGEALAAAVEEEDWNPGKASDAGRLKTTEQQKVATQVVQTKEVIVIQQANPQVIYVPAYNPVVVYGPPIYRSRSAKP
jgi:Protein of unknown function (DUF3300)